MTALHGYPPDLGRPRFRGLDPVLCADARPGSTTEVTAGAVQSIPTRHLEVGVHAAEVARVMEKVRGRDSLQEQNLQVAVLNDSHNSIFSKVSG